MSVAFRRRMAAALHAPSACLLAPDAYKAFRDDALWATSVADLSPLSRKLLDLAEIELDWGERLPAATWNETLDNTLASATLPLSSSIIDSLKARHIDRWPAGTPGGLGGQFKPLSGAVGNVIESLTPEQRPVLQSILEMLSMVRAMRARHVPAEAHYLGPEDVVLREGRVFHRYANEDPSKDAYCTPRQCFTNAMMIAARDSQRTYVEGWAQKPGLIPVHHAWTVNSDGSVYDPTWGHTPNTVYVGVPFKTQYVLHTTVAQGHDTIFTHVFPYEKPLAEDDVKRDIGDPLPSDIPDHSEQIARMFEQPIAPKPVGRSWDGFPFERMTGQAPKPTDTPPERTADGDFILYHGTSRRNADAIMRENRLRPDDLGVVGITTIPGQAQTFAAMSSGRARREGHQEERGGVVLRVVLDKNWLEQQSIMREVGGSGHDQFLIQHPLRARGWHGVPAEAIKFVSVYDFEHPEAKSVFVEMEHPRGFHGRFIDKFDQAMIAKLQGWRDKLGFTEAARTGNSGLIKLPDDLTPLISDLGIDRPREERKGSIARKILGNYTDTRDLYMTQGEYVPNRKLLHDQIIEDTLAGHQPSQKKRVLFMVGGNAVGKSRALKEPESAALMPPDAPVINFDDVKLRLPEFKEMADGGDMYATDGTHFESADVTKRMLDEAIRRGLNVVIDASGNSRTDEFDKTVQFLKDAGYETNVLMVDAPYDEALRSMMKRGVRTGRFVPIPIMRKIHRNAVANHKRWRSAAHIDRFLVFRRDGATLTPVAEGGGGSHRVLNEALYERMLAKADNVDAKAVTPSGSADDDYGNDWGTPDPVFPNVVWDDPDIGDVAYWGNLPEPRYAATDGKALIRVRPHLRDGHPVAGYTREGPLAQLVEGLSKWVRTIADAIGVDPFDVDMNRLEQHAELCAHKPRSRFFFKSPCWASKTIDFAVHRILPALIRDKHPEMADRLMATSPRWGTVHGHSHPIPFPPLNQATDELLREGRIHPSLRAALEREIKATVNIEPYLREGRIVSGYSREFDALVPGGDWKEVFHQATARIADRLRDNKAFNALPDSALIEIGDERDRTVNMYGDDRTRNLVGSLMQGWRSGLSDARAVAIRVAVADRFSLPVPDQVKKYSEHYTGGPWGYGDHIGHEGVRAFVDAVYEASQEILREHQIDKLNVYRGEPLEEAEKPRDEITFWPGTPTTLDQDMAAEYAGGLSNMRYWLHPAEIGRIIQIEIPASQVFGLPDTLGTDADSSEIVIVGGRLPVKERLVQPPPNKGVKARVNVRPYIREGHPVEGYVRELATAVLGDGWSFNPQGLAEPDFSAMRDSVREPFVNPEELVAAFHGLGKDGIRVGIDRVTPSGNGVRLSGHFSTPTYEAGNSDEMLAFMRQFFPFDIDVQPGRIQLNDLFLPVENQSAGVGSSLVRYIEAWGRDHGQQKLTMTAAHIGSYAWARAGFDFKFPGAQQASLLGHDADVLLEDRYLDNNIEVPASVPDSVVEDFVRHFASETEIEDAYDAFYAAHTHLSDSELDQMPDEERAAFIDKAIPSYKFRHVIEIAEFGRDHPWEDAEYGKLWIGKAWLIGRKWDGEKPITGATQKGLPAPILSDLYDRWTRRMEALDAPSFGKVAPDGPTFFRDDDLFWNAYDALGEHYRSQIPPAGSAILKAVTAAVQDEKRVHVRPYIREGHLVTGYWREIVPGADNPTGPYIRRRLPDGMIEAFDARQSLISAISMRNNVAAEAGDRPDHLENIPAYQSAQAEVERLERVAAQAESAVGGRVYRLHETQLPSAEKKIAKLQKAAAKIGLNPPEMHVVGEEYVEPYKRNIPRGQGEQSHWLYIQVTGSEPKVEGWQFIATLQHLPDGVNVIRRVPGSDENINIDKYRDGDARCDYCHTLRDRNDTFLLVNDAGKIQQVGRNCLRDFLGHGTPEQVVSYLEGWQALDDFDLPLDDDEEHGGARVKRHIPTLAYLTHVATMLRTQGWVPRSANMGNATADMARQNYYAWISQEKDRSGRPLWEEPTEDDAKKAQEALQWVREVVANNPNKTEFDHNMSALAQGDYLPDRGEGILAYVLVAHAKAQQREIEMRRRQQTAAASEHIGEIGQRLKLRLTVERVWERPSNYGVTYITKLSDEHGNIVKWFGSYELDQGKTYEATWTIKDHAEFRGAKETVVTRPAKLAEVGEEAGGHSSTDGMVVNEGDRVHVGRRQGVVVRANPETRTGFVRFRAGEKPELVAYDRIDLIEPGK